MDEFETINLDSKECKICKQETGEELISCILRDRFSTEERSIFPTYGVSPNEDGEPSFAHRVCLERWDTVMKNTCFPQPKKTWKDRLKGFISTGSANNNVTETWTPVDYNVGPASDAVDKFQKFESSMPDKARSCYSVFSESKEAYRVENVGKRDSERDHWRRNKVRICSVDSEGEDEKHVLTSERNVYRRTRTELNECDILKLTEIAEKLKLQINGVSSDLVTHLQVRDDLLLQKHTMKVTVGKLIHLQSNIKTSSSHNVPRSTDSTKSWPSNVIIT